MTTRATPDRSSIDRSSPSTVAAFSGPDRYDDASSISQLVHLAIAALGLPRTFIRPGDRVVLKPNWIKENDERHPTPDHWEHVITHPAVIEATVRWVAAQLDGDGSIVVCDAPQTDSSFARIRQYCQLDAMVARCRAAFPGLDIALLDLRPEEWRSIDGVTVSRRALPGDPLGSTHVKLDEESEFIGHEHAGRLYGASYDMAETNTVHRGVRHEYMLCRTPMDADVLINLPKLKTHKKVGLTCALKNLVGINANKNWLPHHTEGAAGDGGDQFPVATRKTRLEHTWMGTAKRWLKHRPRLARAFVPLKSVGRLYFGDTQQVVRSGNWSGNDTCWRMVLDLNKCLYFFDGAGGRRCAPLRYLSIVDGIVAGEGNGPLSADPKPCGVILAGTHPVAVDCVAATLMGFDLQKIRLLRQSFQIRELNFVPFAPNDVVVTSNHPAWNGPLHEMREVFAFRPHFGWVGAIEADRQPAPATRPSTTSVSTSPAP